MKKVVLSNIILFISFFGLITSCSEDDSPGTTPTNQNVGEVFRGQVVSIDLGDKTLTEEEYFGTLGIIDVVLSKSQDESQLVFLVPFNAEIGEQDLLIPSLNNTTIQYLVKDVVPADVPEVATEPLFQNFDRLTVSLSQSTSPDAAMAINNIEHFKNYFENHATDDDKLQISRAYEANKELFDNILIEDFSTPTGRFTRDDKVILGKFVLAVMLIDGGSILAVRGPHPGIKALGIVIAGIATTKAIDYYVQFIEKEVKELGININSLSGNNSRNAQTTALSLTSDQASVFTLKTERRKLDATDQNTSIALLKSVFDSRNYYNKIVTSVNEAIDFVNTHIPFVEFDFIQLAHLEDTSTTVLALADQEVFNNYAFTVSDPNLELKSVSFEGDGQISIKIKLAESITSSPYESFLNYSYNDELNSFSGKIPLQIIQTENPLIGTWILESFSGGIPVGEYEEMTLYDCPNIAYQKETFLSFTLIFTANVVTMNESIRTVYYNRTWDPSSCTIESDGPDTEETDNFSDKLSYVFDGGSLRLSDDELGEDAISLHFLNENKIQLDGNLVFVRQ